MTNVAAIVIAFAAGFALAALQPLRSVQSPTNATIAHELTKNLPDDYFPISTGGIGGQFGTIHAEYGALQADQEMCGFTIPETVKTFIDADLRTFSAAEQSGKIELAQTSHSFTKEMYADDLKYSNISAVCAQKKAAHDYNLSHFPENETDNLLKMIGEWQAVNVYCTRGFFPSFATEKMEQMGVTYSDIDGKYKDRLKHWTDVYYNTMKQLQSSDVGKICYSAALTSERLENDYLARLFAKK